jgi:hypothetical protein
MGGWPAICTTEAIMSDIREPIATYGVDEADWNLDHIEAEIKNASHGNLNHYERLFGRVGDMADSPVGTNPQRIPQGGIADVG